MRGNVVNGFVAIQLDALVAGKGNVHPRCRKSPSEGLEQTDRPGADDEGIGGDGAGLVQGRSAHPPVAVCPLVFPVFGPGKAALRLVMLFQVGSLASRR